jgi:GGDEF domain-containing protein
MKAGLEAVDLHTPDGVKIPLSCCIGYALFKGSYKSWSPALKEANEAIHAAKAIGRGNIVSVAG